jgi:UDP-glucose 4-epimerase
MKILLTGGAGFIGSYVLRAYLNAGHQVVVLDDLSTGRREAVPYTVPFYRADICDRAALAEVMQQLRPDIVNHHAGVASVRSSQRNPERILQVNVQGTANVLRAARSSGVRKFIFASSGGAVYGDAKDLPVAEGAPLAPISAYGESKVQAEQLIMQEDGRFESIILRYGNVYGPGQDPRRDNGVIPIFAHDLLIGKVPKIYGDGNQRRDYVYVSDVAEANLKALICGSFGVFNIGTGLGYRVDEVYQLIGRSLCISAIPDYQPHNPFEVKDVVLNVNRAETVLGWRAKVSFEEGLARTLTAIAPRARSIRKQVVSEQ